MFCLGPTLGYQNRICGNPQSKIPNLKSKIRRPPPWPSPNPPARSTASTQWSKWKHNRMVSSPKQIQVGKFVWIDLLTEDVPKAKIFYAQLFCGRIEPSKVRCRIFCHPAGCETHRRMAMDGLIYSECQISRGILWRKQRDNQWIFCNS